MTLVCSVGVLELAAPRGDSLSDRWWAHVSFLASDALEGRETGSSTRRFAARTWSMLVPSS